MTQVPFVEWHKLSKADGPDYEVVQLCSHPTCKVVMPLERHHLVRRSFLAGPYDWVEYDGVLIANKVALCNEHHRQITDNEAYVSWNELGFFEWGMTHTDALRERLNPQPQIGEERPDVPDSADVYPEVCPACKRPHRKKPKTLEQARERKNWNIHVPADERENGADVLDTLLEEGRREMAEAGLAYGDEDNARYFVLAAILSQFVVNAHKFLGDE